jgi:sec-independent protein translocase protein TatB
MFNLDPGKLIVIAVVAIILLGPDRLPQVARQVGGAWRSFNEFRHRMETEMRSSMPDLPPTSEIARLARSPSALLNHLSNMSSDGDDPEEAADGTFQPPVVPDAVAGNGQAASPDLVADTAAETPPAMPAPPAPARGDRPAQPPRQSEVIVPSDPTLN